MTALLTTAEAVHGGINAQARSWRGVDGMEQRVGRLADVVESAAQGYVTLVYDIPEKKRSACPNPSRTLWPHGFRLNFSCWVMPKERLAHADIVALLAHWKAHGIRAHVIEYAESQMAVVRGIAREKLEEEVRRVHTSLIEGIIAADDALKAALDEEAPEGADELAKAEADIEARHDHKARVRSRLSQASRELDAAIGCAELFDEREALSDLFEGVRAALRSREGALQAATASRRAA